MVFLLGKNVRGRGREMLNSHYQSHLFYIAEVSVSQRDTAHLLNVCFSKLDSRHMPIFVHSIIFNHFEV